MTEKTTARSITSAAVAVTLLLAGITTAGDDALIRIERRADADRNALIEAGVTLIAETNDALFATGSPTDVGSAAQGRSLIATVVEQTIIDTRFAMAGLRPGFTETDLLVCGAVIARGADWLLLKECDFASPECLESSGWFLHVLDMDPLAAIKEQPVPRVRFGNRTPWFRRWSIGSTAPWPCLTGPPCPNQPTGPPGTRVHRAASMPPPMSTICSPHSGSQPSISITPAATPTTSSAPFPVSPNPELVYIAIGHLDDLPSSGPRSRRRRQRQRDSHGDRSRRSHVGLLLRPYHQIHRGHR